MTNDQQQYLTELRAIIARLAALGISVDTMRPITEETFKEVEDND